LAEHPRLLDQWAAIPGDGAAGDPRLHWLPLAAMAAATVGDAAAHQSRRGGQSVPA
jgi:hypothetical protein